MNLPTPGSSWPGQGTIPAPTAPPRPARAREINTSNARPRDRHRSLADGDRRTQISPRGTNAHDVIQRYFVDVIRQLIRLRLNEHGDLDHARSIMPGSILNETQRRARRRKTSRTVSRCSPTEPASRPRLVAGAAAKSLPVQNRMAPRHLSVHRNSGMDPGTRDPHGRRPCGFLALVLPSNLKTGHHRKNALLDLKTLFATPCITQTSAETELARRADR